MVRLEGITKRFGAVTANRDITLDIHAGRILALCRAARRRISGLQVPPVALFLFSGFV